MKGWWRKHALVRKIAITCGGLYVLVIGFQLAYPSDLALPFAEIDNKSVSMMRKDEIAKQVQDDYGDTKIVTTIHNKTTATPLQETGLKIDTKKINSQLTDYPWYWRIIPFSSAIMGVGRNVHVAHYADQKEFIVYASERGKECSIAPKDAGVVVKNGEVQLDKAVHGSECKSSDLAKQLTAVPLNNNKTEVKIVPTTVQPKRLDKDVQNVLGEARKITAHKITLDAMGKMYKVNKVTLASWLSFPEDPKTKKLTVATSPDAIKAYLAIAQKEVQTKPGVTTITTRDGIEVSRVNGASGRGIDETATAKAIAKQVTTGSGTVKAAIAPLPPTLHYIRSYSKTPEGLQALLDDIVKGKDMAISVRRLGDAGVSANGNKRYHPASTYKLLVAYSVLKRIDAGRLSWGKTASGGQTVAQCFDKMIVSSDNPCAEWFGGTAIGWGAVHNEARALGLNNTVLNSAFVSTANDQALFLQKLESNQLGLREESRAKLINAMKRQVFRKGIPAGASAPVADKVGFLDGLLHDSAIVYAPSGVYVIVIYSNGSSWGAIADAARQVQAQIQ
jgi:beta-lactamase class A